ncbi:glycosyltransferase [Candidatus Pelagibacter sp.]|nr:glycosyltransferase [Candidatus Pelagibacter sp.]
MKISILLPLKENFSPSYAGAVSLFINDTLRSSEFRKNITVFGYTNYKKKFNQKYYNIDIKKKIFSSQNKEYVKKFIEIEKKNNSQIIELHNRPIYLRYLVDSFKEKDYILYFHNDPLTMSGSKSIKERSFLLDNCYRIVFNSNWSKKRFLQNMKSDAINSEKLIVINQSASKNKIDFRKKERIITFVGKLNIAKGYDLFGNAVTKILKKHKNWVAYVVGDEPRDKLDFKHERLKNFGFKEHKEVIKIYKKTSIAVVCSRWDEPFGRTSLEAAANGCAVIISNRGGLPETITNGRILKNLNVKEIYKNIEDLIKNSSIRKKYQKLSYENFYLSHEYVSEQIDKIRKNLIRVNKPFLSSSKSKLRILHITNFNERHNGRLFFNTGRRLNNGFIRLGHSVLEFSDRDIVSRGKSIKDFYGSNTLNDKLVKTCYHFKPDLIVLGHADMISKNILYNLKKDYTNLKIAQWFLDPLNKNGPDFQKNKKRILDKSDIIDTNFITTSPDALGFLPKNTLNYFIPNPSDQSMETLNNFKKNCSNDVFFALSHGVHRGQLKNRSFDDREKFINSLINKCKNIRFDIFGMNNIQPIWADQYFKNISNSKMGLNLSRGSPIKYYSSDRITQIIGNGLVTLIDEKTCYGDFFDDTEMVFYKNITDLSEKIEKISEDEKLRKTIGQKGKAKYMKYFNSTLVADFIVNKTYEINSKKKYLWHKT